MYSAGAYFATVKPDSWTATVKKVARSPGSTAILAIADRMRPAPWLPQTENRALKDWVLC